MNAEWRGDLEFLRNLVLRAEPDRRSEAVQYLIWGLTWLVAFGLGAAFPRSWQAGLGAVAVVVAVVVGPSVLRSLRSGSAEGAATPAPPLLWRAFNAGIGAAVLLASGLVWVLHAWTAQPVADGGVWLLVIGAAYLAGSRVIRGLHGWLGAWFFVAGLLIPGLLPGLRAASVADLAAGAGGFLAAALVAWRLAA